VEFWLAWAHVPGQFLIKVTIMQSGREIARQRDQPSTELSTASVDKETAWFGQDSFVGLAG
jgi:hypothetical protein